MHRRVKERRRTVNGCRYRHGPANAQRYFWGTGRASWPARRPRGHGAAGTLEAAQEVARARGHRVGPVDFQVEVCVAAQGRRIEEVRERQGWIRGVGGGVLERVRDAGEDDSASSIARLDTEARETGDRHRAEGHGVAAAAVDLRLPLLLHRDRHRARGCILHARAQDRPNGMRGPCL